MASALLHGDDEDGLSSRYHRLLDGGGGHDDVYDEYHDTGGGGGGGDDDDEIVGGAGLAHNTLGFWAGLALVVSDIIGSGIFASPGIVLHWSGSVGGSLLMWMMAGIITYVGFACLAELSVMDPSAGGLYYYLRVNFGG